MNHRNTEDKSYWCQIGLERELEFVERAQANGHDIILNPAKLKDKYAPDLLSHGALADVKCARDAFYTSGRYDRDPNFAMPFNRKDLVRYLRLYPGILVYFWLCWPARTNYGKTVKAIDRVFKASIERLEDLCTRAPEHFYKRRQNDTKGNAKSSFLLDVRCMEELSPWLLPCDPAQSSALPGRRAEVEQGCGGVAENKQNDSTGVLEGPRQ